MQDKLISKVHIYYMLHTAEGYDAAVTQLNSIQV